MSNREEMSTSLLVKQTNAGNHGPGGPRLPCMCPDRPWCAEGTHYNLHTITPLAFEEVHLYKLIKIGTK